MDKEKHSQILRLRKYFLIFGTLFTLITIVSLYLNTQEEQKVMSNYALGMAKVSFEKDLTYRLWASMHGGVYVPKTDKTPPNKYLKNVEERDIITSSGKELTLINPAYMTRQVYELEQNKMTIIGHITSLNPLNPINKPDEWERKALLSFEHDTLEVHSEEIINGKKYLRYIKGLVTEKSCLKCHEEQGYKVGDIRGGISISIPIKSYVQIYLSHIKNIRYVHLFGWFFVVVLGFVSYKRISNSMAAKYSAEKNLVKNLEKYKTILNTTNDGFWIADESGRILEVNDSYCAMSGYTKEEIALLRIYELDFRETEEDFLQKIKSIKQTGYLRFETVHTKKDNSKFNVEISASYLSSIENLIIVFIRDITTRKQMETTLKEREKFLLTVQKIAKLGNYKLDFSNGIWESSEVLNEIFGIEDSFEYSLDGWLKIVFEDDREMMLNYFQNEVIGKRIPFDKEYRIRRLNDGEIRWVQGDGELQTDNSNNLTFMIGTISDITERKNYEEQIKINESRFRNYFESSPIATFIWQKENDDFVLTTINKAGLKLSNDTAMDFIGLSLNRIYNDREDIKSDFWKCFNKKKTFSKEINYLTSGSKSENIVIFTFAYIDESTVLLHTNDITEKYRAEEELIKHRFHLEELVQQRTKELKEVNSKLEEEVENRKKAESLVKSALQKERDLNKLKTDFISMTSHEFRTPLTSILASADFLEMFGSKIPADKMHKHLMNIQNSVTDMNLLLEDVLTVSRIEKGKITNSPIEINLKDFCINLVEQHETQLKKNQKIGLKFFAEEQFVIDPKLLKHMLSNLLSNAIKYSHENGKIELTALDQNDELIFKVSDNGLGIPKKELNLIFEQFKRSSKTTEIQGTGLGLYIVKTSVDMLNGKIEVESTEDEGSTFTIKLPRQL